MTDEVDPIRQRLSVLLEDARAVLVDAHDSEEVAGELAGVLLRAVALLQVLAEDADGLHVRLIQERLQLEFPGVKWADR